MFDDLFYATRRSPKHEREFDRIVNETCVRMAAAFGTSKFKLKARRR